MAGSGMAAAAPKPAALTAFDSYIAQVESRLEKQHRSANELSGAGGRSTAARGRADHRAGAATLRARSARSHAASLARHGLCAGRHGRGLRADDEGFRGVPEVLRAAGGSGSHPHAPGRRFPGADADPPEARDHGSAGYEPRNQRSGGWMPSTDTAFRAARRFRRSSRPAPTRSGRSVRRRTTGFCGA